MNILKQKKTCFASPSFLKTTPFKHKTLWAAECRCKVPRALGPLARVYSIAPVTQYDEGLACHLNLDDMFEDDLVELLDTYDAKHKEQEDLLHKQVRVFCCCSFCSSFFHL